MKLHKTGTLRFADLDFLPAPVPTCLEPLALPIVLGNIRALEAANGPVDFDLYYDYLIPLRISRKVEVR